MLLLGRVFTRASQRADMRRLGFCAQTNLGHCHPTVTEAVSKQIGKITHVQCAIGMSGPHVKLGESFPACPFLLGALGSCLPPPPSQSSG